MRRIRQVMVRDRSAVPIDRVIGEARRMIVTMIVITVVQVHMQQDLSRASVRHVGDATIMLCLVHEGDGGLGDEHGHKRHTERSEPCPQSCSAPKRQGWYSRPIPP